MALYQVTLNLLLKNYMLYNTDCCNIYCASMSNVGERKLVISTTYAYQSIWTMYMVRYIDFDGIEIHYILMITKLANNIQDIM